jgi:hypothetical protein
VLRENQDGVPNFLAQTFAEYSVWDKLVGSTLFYFQLIHKSLSSLSITVLLPLLEKEILCGPTRESRGAESGISAALSPYTYSPVVLAQLYTHLQNPRNVKATSW